MSIISMVLCLIIGIYYFYGIIYNFTPPNEHQFIHQGDIAANQWLTSSNNVPYLVG
jgi:hypothetical protein